jgi:hypothetical protein
VRSAGQIVDDAIAKAAKKAIYDGPKPAREANLVWAIATILSDAPEVRLLSHEYRCPLNAWTRDPGGIDLVAELADDSLLLMEMKVDKPDESLWDGIKLADFAVSQADRRPTCFLIYDGAQTVWSRSAGSALFTEPEKKWGVQEMIERWPNAWVHLLIGGRGIRPESSIAAVDAIPLQGAAHSFEGARTLRALQIGPTPDAQSLQFDSDGWPIGYEPPDDLRAKGRQKDLARETETSSEAPSISDPCHGYPWYDRWSKHRISQVAAEIDEDARACLRNRLMHERRWTEDELASCGLDSAS